MAVLDRIRSRAEDTRGRSDPVVDPTEGELLYRPNDLRLYQYFYLAEFRRYLVSSGIPEAAWKLNKDEIGGVWMMAVHSNLSLRPLLKKLSDAHGASLWLHIQLRTDALFSDGNKPVGEIQLRTDKAPLELAHEIGDTVAFPEGARFRTRVGGYKTGKVVAVSLSETDLSYARLEERLRLFAQPFFSI